MKKAVVVLAWYFAAFGTSYLGHTMTPNAIGPFRDESDCNKYRESLAKHVMVTFCWWDGKP